MHLKARKKAAQGRVVAALGRVKRVAQELNPAMSGRGGRQRWAVCLDASTALCISPQAPQAQGKLHEVPAGTKGTNAGEMIGVCLSESDVSYDSERLHQTQHPSGLALVCAWQCSAISCAGANLVSLLSLALTRLLSYLLSLQIVVRFVVLCRAVSCRAILYLPPWTGSRPGWTTSTTNGRPSEP